MKRKTLCKNGNTVFRWHDKRTRSVVVQTLDPEGNQLGEADWSGNKVSGDFAQAKAIKANGGEVEPKEIKIRVEWHGFNYGRGDSDPVFIKEDETIETARVTPKMYVVRYGDGRVKKQLKRFYRGGGFYGRGADPTKPRTSWTDYYGSHERCSRTKLVFMLLSEDPKTLAE